MWDFIQNHWRSLLEILILGIAIYFILRFIRGTRGASVLLGLVMLLLLLTAVSQVFDLRTINWLLGHFFAFIVVALVVIFQPELRRALAELGSRPILFSVSNEKEVIDVLSRTAASFSARRVGALIAVEREIDLRGMTEVGATLDARLSQELLDQIFFQNSPLHDGGVVIRNDRVEAVACIFPLTQRTDLAKSVGTRHRAALGLSEETDAVVLVVSEETGRISVASVGRLYQDLSAEDLRHLLLELLVGGPKSSWLGQMVALIRKFKFRTSKERA